MALLARNRALAAICVLASSALCGGEKPIIDAGAIDKTVLDFLIRTGKLR
jgi:hypothetical protein